MVTTHRLSLDNIERSAKVIDPEFTGTPQFNCEPLSQALGTDVVLKVETLNPIRSFKGRGADFFMSETRETFRDQNLVCATAGNFGQAMAYVCRSNQRPLIIYSATTANAMKIERMRSMGAQVRQVGDNFDAAKEHAKAFCAETGSHFVEDGRDIAISEGAGSIAVELMENPRFDTVLVPLGNGALITGMARWIKHVSPSTKVVGVSSAFADAMFASWKSGSIVERESANTIADGIAVRTPVPEAVTDMMGIVDDVLLISEESLKQAMKLVFDKAGLVTEPAGVAGIAAILDHQSLRKSKLATVICGSNLTAEQMEMWLR